MIWTLIVLEERPVDCENGRVLVVCPFFHPSPVEKCDVKDSEMNSLSWRAVSRRLRLPHSALAFAVG